MEFNFLGRHEGAYQISSPNQCDSPQRRLLKPKMHVLHDLHTDPCFDGNSQHLDKMGQPGESTISNIISEQDDELDDER